MGTSGFLYSTGLEVPQMEKGIEICLNGDKVSISSLQAGKYLLFNLFSSCSITERDFPLQGLGRPNPQSQAKENSL